MFKITNGKGFHITFPNGVTVSVQFGVANYCANYPTLILTDITSESIKQAEAGSHDAEIAIWDKDGNWITKKFKQNEDNIIGYQSPNDLLKILIWAEQYKK